MSNKLTCDKCSRQFHTLCELKTHKKVDHQQQHRYTCFACDKHFEEKCKLLDHISECHHGVKIYSCERCKQTVASKVSEERHRKECHGSEKYQCPHCGHVLGRNDTLRENIKGKHSSWELKCHCGKTYRWRSSYLRIIKKCNTATVPQCLL